MSAERERALEHGPTFRAGSLTRTTRIDHVLLGALARFLAGVPIRFVLWDGTEKVAARDLPVASVIIRDRPTLVRLVWNPDLYFGEAYVDRRVDVEGDLVGMLTAIARKLAPGAKRGLLTRARRWGGGDMATATRNARHHYDVGNDFYQLWLDEELVYTCAYFATPELSLEDAQRAKLEYVARKPALQPGERVYEAGCGWGALALYLARTRGVIVRAWNVSHEQIVWARQRAQEEGLADRVEFIEGDYRSMDGGCDAFVSVGMLEHVGAAHYASLARVIGRTLDPRHGRGLLHFIGRNVPMPMSAWISRYIFPGAYIPALREVLEGVLEPEGLSVLDVENLRAHYAVTLAHWLERFEAAAAGVTAEFGEAFTRIWRLYLAQAQAGFRAGSLQLFQVTFARNADDRLPWTRARLYSASETP
jgi:cyclopropane-fatty-acyl-phospholipid synthase